MKRISLKHTKRGQNWGTRDRPYVMLNYFQYYVEVKARLFSVIYMDLGFNFFFPNPLLNYIFSHLYIHTHNTHMYQLSR